MQFVAFCFLKIICFTFIQEFSDPGTWSRQSHEEDDKLVQAASLSLKVCSEICCFPLIIILVSHLNEIE